MEKLTDNEIIKALQDMGNEYEGNFSNKVLDLINRKNAEIERLEKENHSFADIGKLYSEIKSEAIKEFWDKLKEKRLWDVDIPDYVFVYDGDDLVKEMEGE